MTMLQTGETAAPASVAKDTTTQTFVKDVLEESKRQPVLVDFWAEWCGPCKQLAPVLEKVVRAAKGKVKLVKMDIDKHPSIPGQLGIQSIPAVFAFVNGQPVDGFLGALPESQVTAFIERLTKDRIGGEEQDLLKGADEALAKGDPAGAADLYARVLAQDSGNVAALAGLARSYVRTGRSSRPSRRWRWCRKASAMTPRWPPRRPRSILPSRQSRSGRSASSSRRLRPIRSTIRHASISRSP